MNKIINYLPLKLSEEEGVSLLLGYVKGVYRSLSGNETKVFMGLYFNSFYDKSPYSFCYFSKGQVFFGHHSPFDKDQSVEVALLEAWQNYIVCPHYWTVVDQYLMNQFNNEMVFMEYSTRLKKISECIEYFKVKNLSLLATFGDDKIKYENSRLFYPKL